MSRCKPSAEDLMYVRPHGPLGLLVVYVYYYIDSA